MDAYSMEYILRVMHIIQTDATVSFVSARGMHDVWLCNIHLDPWLVSWASFCWPLYRVNNKKEKKRNKREKTRWKFINENIEDNTPTHLLGVNFCWYMFVGTEYYEWRLDKCHRWNEIDWHGMSWYKRNELWEKRERKEALVWQKWNMFRCVFSACF